MKRRPPHTRKLGRSYPALGTLLDALEAAGVDDGGAHAIVLALATGSQWYADRLVGDVATWRRYQAALHALESGACPLDLCDVVIGALAWTYIEGSGFVAEVSRRTTLPAAGVH